MKRIVFLDFDGVLTSPRASLALGEYGLTQLFDPVAVGFLNRLYESVEYEIVVTSTWRHGNDCPKLLKVGGVQAPCHDDWRTKDLLVPGTPDMTERPREIEDWLARNAPKANYIIVDDDHFAWTRAQSRRWCRCNCYDGLTLKAMVKAFDLFGARWPQISRDEARERAKRAA